MEMDASGGLFPHRRLWGISGGDLLREGFRPPAQGSSSCAPPGGILTGDAIGV